MHTIDSVLYTGRTHTLSGRDGSGRLGSSGAGCSSVRQR